MADADELYTLKNAFYLGNFQVRVPPETAFAPTAPTRARGGRGFLFSCSLTLHFFFCQLRLSPFSLSQEVLAEAEGLRLKTDALRMERDVFVYRALVGLGQHA
jgi:hypothetical protein